MELLNRVWLGGHVKRDAEAIETSDGKTVLDFCLVVPASDGKTEVFVDVTAFGEVSDSVDGYVSCGERMTVTGAIDFRTWTDNNGRWRTSKVVVADSITEED